MLMGVCTVSLYLYILCLITTSGKLVTKSLVGFLFLFVCLFLFWLNRPKRKPEATRTLYSVNETNTRNEKEFTCIASFLRSVTPFFNN